MARDIGNRSIEGLVLDFYDDLGPLGAPETIEESSEAFHAFIRCYYDAEFGGLPLEQRSVLGFFVAGYSDGQPFPEEFEFLFPRDDAPVAARPADGFGASWRGIDLPFTRIYKGFDPYVVPLRLQAEGLSEDAIERVLSPDALETAVIFDGMPIQDAVNFAVYILETTIGWATFAIGMASCGGFLQVATILSRNRVSLGCAAATRGSEAGEIGEENRVCSAIR